jgi:hypothetical protein
MGAGAFVFGIHLLKARSPIVRPKQIGCLLEINSGSKQSQSWLLPRWPSEKALVLGDSICILFSILIGLGLRGFGYL